LILFGILPLFTIRHYFLFRVEPIQEIKLKNGEILKVRPYVATNAEVINPEILNAKNSKEKLFGYQFNDSSAKWNGLIRYFSKNDYSQNLLFSLRELGDFLSIPIEEHKNLGKIDIDLSTDGSLYISGQKYTDEISKDDWEFDSLNSVIKTKQYYFQIANHSYLCRIYHWVLWSKEKLIFKHKTDSIFVKYIGVDSYQKSYAILKINSDYSEDFLNQRENSIPFFYSHEIPSNFFNFRDPRFEWSKYFNWLYWKMGNSESSIKAYFIEAPFLGIIQFCFNTNKKYLTTPFFIVYSLVLVLFYLGIVSFIKWVISGFNEIESS
jgi:hypothetical protein